MVCYMLGSFIHIPTEGKWYKSTRVVCTILCVCFWGCWNIGTCISAYFSAGTMLNTLATAIWRFYGYFIVKSRCLSVFLVSALIVSYRFFVNLLKFTWPNFGKISLCYTTKRMQEEEVATFAAAVGGLLRASWRHQKAVAPPLIARKTPHV